MAKAIVWSLKAQRDRKNILEYWINKTKSNTYSLKLNQLFIDSIEIVSEFPRIGRLTEVDRVRVKIVKDYLIFYEEKGHQILILSIWDSRQDSKRNPLIS